MPILSATTRKLFRFIFNFFLANACLSLLIGINYITILPDFAQMTNGPSATAWIWFFLVISFIAQIALVVFVSFLLVFLINCLLPRQWLIVPLSILLGAAVIFCLIGDSIAFRLYHMHYAAVGIEIFKVNALSQVISFSVAEVLKLVIAGFVLFLLESLIAYQTWKRTKLDGNGRWRYILAGIFAGCVAASYGFNYAARNTANLLSENNRYLMVKATRFLPYYDELYQMLVPFSDKTQRIKTMAGEINFTPYSNRHPLDYPKHVLQCQPESKPLNIVVIVVDTWRFDAMSAEATPNIYQFAKKAAQFQNHWSGGNCTKSGLFSFFYGLPGNYWGAFLRQQRGPELIHQLVKANYKMAVFASAALTFPAFDRTVFQEIKPLIRLTPGETTVARDERITKNFKQFLLSRDARQPFFSFIFYDEVHNYCEPTTPDQHPFKPWLKICNRLMLKKSSNPRRYMKRYLNSVYFVDSQIKQVFDALQKQHLFKDTIVIVTADHGEEINDHHSGYWQHASAYTSYQLHTPLLVYWPGEKPRIYKHFTTHYDFVPTIMTRVLHCQNPSSDYAIGESLFSIVTRPVLISGSYADYAIISKDQIARIYPGGDYGLDDGTGQPLANRSLQPQPLQQAFNYLHHYFK